jgi:histidine triad (HIT) family protein
MSSIFTKIINNEIPSYKIFENNDFIAFLDVNPVALGHTLIVPKYEVDYIFELDKNLLSSILLFSQYISKALELSIPCKRIGIAVIGLEVPHAHMHLIPINQLSDMDFSKERLKLSVSEYSTLLEKITSNLNIV